MSQDLQLIKLLRDISNRAQSGHLRIEANSVTWDFYLNEGKLQYATHSLQSVDTLKHYLLPLNSRAVERVIPLFDRHLPQHCQLIPVANKLVDGNHLSVSQRKILLTKLTQDALESGLWLSEGQSNWQQGDLLQTLDGTDSWSNILELPPLLESLQSRLQAWQKLNPIFSSPYQRPVCANPLLLKQKIPGGTLSSAILQKLAKLMRGSTFRELGLFLKQDDWKVAQLLSPYIENKLLQLYPPKPPLDKLPSIPRVKTPLQLGEIESRSPQKIDTPTKTLDRTISKGRSPQVTSKAISTPTNSITPSQTDTSASPAKKSYKIVCIDDSPTMLDTLKNYLDARYEVYAIDNPMKSLPSLFDSKPDLILMDFSMPGINGNRLCNILKSSSIFKNTPIVMISGNAKMLDADKIQATGATDFLAKPFTREILLAMVEKHLLDN